MLHLLRLFLDIFYLETTKEAGFYFQREQRYFPVGLHWKSDQPDAETSTWQHTQHSQETDIHATGGIRTRNPCNRAAADPRRRQRGHGDRPVLIYMYILIFKDTKTVVKVRFCRLQQLCLGVFW
jgi:hypothetical protein